MYLYFVSEICYLRLDFEQFQTLGPSGLETNTNGGECARDALTFAVSNSNLPLASTLFLPWGHL